MVAFLALLLFGSVPLWRYVAFRALDVQAHDTTFAVACGIAALTTLVLDAEKAGITKQTPLASGLLMLLNGNAAAGCAYLAGFLLEKVLWWVGCL